MATANGEIGSIPLSVLSFCTLPDNHVCEAGGARRSWLRGLLEVGKRYLMQVGGHNLVAYRWQWFFLRDRMRRSKPAQPWCTVTEITRILSAVAEGEAAAAEQLWPLVYEELRQLAAQRLAQEKPGQTLQATALVHEAFLRLVGGEAESHWNSRGHFFAAAA